jgi:glycosyltransferase involved in cell wall biosynthesis
LKVLHIIENLNVGAVENWLVRVTQEASQVRPDIKWTFYCTLGVPGKLDADVRQYGCEIIYSQCSLNEKSKFFIHLRRELKRGGYDILHCHHDLLSAFYLVASIGVKIHRRIVHVHNTDEALPTSSRIKYKMLAEPMRQLCLKRSDHIAGISEHVLRKFVRGAGPKPGRDVVVYYGLDVQRFANPKTDSSTLRRSLGLPADSKMLLFLGRMNELKNPCFVVEVLKHSRECRIRSCFCRHGALESSQRMIWSLAEKRVRVLGWRATLSLCCTLLMFCFRALRNPERGRACSH